MSKSRDLLNKTIEKLQRLNNLSDDDIEKCPFIILAGVPHEKDDTEVGAVQITVNGTEDHINWLLCNVIVQEPELPLLIKKAEIDLQLDKAKHSDSQVPSFESFMGMLMNGGDLADA